MQFCFVQNVLSMNEAMVFHILKKKQKRANCAGIQILKTQAVCWNAAIVAHTQQKVVEILLILLFPWVHLIHESPIGLI